MTSFLKKLVPVLVVAVLFSAVPAMAAMQGAADYHSSLTTGISSSATSLTVVSTSTPDGEPLQQGAIYGIKLGGREYAIGTLGAGKTFTSLIRGVSQISGTTTGGTAESWGRGTAVEITDAPVLLELINKLAGRQWIDNALRYTGVTTGTLGLDGNNIASVDYVNSISFGAVGQANETTAGFSELSTQAEAAAGTSVGGTGARLVLGGNLATSTYNANTAAQRVVTTDGTGKIDDDFIPTTITNAHTYTGAQTFTGTSTTATSSAIIGSFPAYWIGKNMQAFATPGTSTFPVPSGISKVQVIVTAGGNNGGGGSGSSSGGGGAGATCIKNVDVSATTSVQVFVGSTAQWSTFGTNGFYCSAATGVVGDTSGGGNGGAATGGDINVAGGNGSYSHTASSGSASGVGGSGFWGGSGAYGSGGSGNGSAGSYSGGTGTQGVVIVQW